MNRFYLNGMKKVIINRLTKKSEDLRNYLPFMPLINGQLLSRPPIKFFNPDSISVGDDRSLSLIIVKYSVVYYYPCNVFFCTLTHATTTLFAHQHSLPVFPLHFFFLLSLSIFFGKFWMLSTAEKQSFFCRSVFLLVIQ